MSDRRLVRRKQVFRARRRRLSWKRERKSMAQIAADAVVGIIGGVSTAIVMGQLGQRVDSVEEMWVPVVGGLIAVAIWEVVCRPLSNYLWAVPEAMFMESQDELISTKARIADLQESVAALQAQVNKTRKNQAFADVLTKQYDHGLHEIMNWKGLRKHSKFTNEIAAEWHQREKAWTQGVRDLLEAQSCTAQVIAHFWNLHKVELGAYHPNVKMNHALSMFSIRLDRLKAIIDMYSETPILAE
jgi:uncharacterized membrane protein YeaQ/YmgE (transglycosylase-associated protein family)